MAFNFGLMTVVNIILPAQAKARAQREREREVEAERQDDFARRRILKQSQGWDECGANGESHSPDSSRQPDGRLYCKYCGAEFLPEECVEIEGIQW